MDTTVEYIRYFNRFYLPRLGLLGNNYLDSSYSAAEARILFEIYEKDGITAKEIASRMNLDKGYLSRTLKDHEKHGYIIKEKGEEDGRSYSLHLTAEGLLITKDFIEKSNVYILSVISSLSEKDKKELKKAMEKIVGILGGEV